MKQWTLSGDIGAERLELEEVEIPEVGDYDVLVKFHAASLNYRDVMLSQGSYSWGRVPKIVPVSDGAGEVYQVGSKVTKFQKGQRVMPTFSQTFMSGKMSMSDAFQTLGSHVNGVMREYGSFHENGLLEVPSHLSYEEAATLPCAGVTAWNSLYGLRSLRAGDVVLTQGSGGVSVFALQFAKAAGAQVISTTSTPEKAEKLKELGAHHVINYKEIPEWGAEAKRLSLGGRGTDFVVDIGGLDTLVQSSQAAAVDSVVAVIGRNAEPSDGSMPVWHPHATLHLTRRILVGNKAQFEEMNRAIEVNQIHPVVDSRRFNFKEFPQALEYVSESKHLGKVVIKISE